MTLRCDLLAVGTELLLGQIVDSNSAWLGERLAAAGIGSHLHVQVGDNVGRIERQLRNLLADADCVIICGGLGPTHDDLTREAIAAVMGDVDLVLDEDVAAVIAEMFAARGREMTHNNLRQAMVPEGATVIPQTTGTAPGLICPVVIGGVTKTVYAMPGVPSEMREMFGRAVLPDLLGRDADAGTIVSQVIKVWGESESGLNARLEDIIEELDQRSDVTLAFLARGWNGLEIRLTARAATTEVAAELVAPFEAEIRRRLGARVFGVNGDSMESVVLGLLHARGETLGLAESLTAGLVTGRLGAIPGCSSVLRGGIVSYASDVKFNVLGVEPGPVVAPEAALEMALGAKRVLDADWGLALTGVAGPDRQEGVPVGTVHIAVSGPTGDRTHLLRLGERHDRETVCQMAVINALDLLRHQLLAAGGTE